MPEVDRVDREADAPKPDPAPKGSPLRLALLLAALLALIAALAWDRQVARPQNAASLARLQEEVERRAASTEPQLTPEEVRELIGRPPASSETGELYRLDRFRWLSGVPWRPYSINVVYRVRSEGARLLTVYHNSDPDPQLMPDYRPPVPEAPATPTGDDFQ